MPGLPEAARVEKCTSIDFCRNNVAGNPRLVVDDGDRDVLPKSIQLIAGRTGQEYNQRKRRKGAFWEDRYHATAVEGDEHLALGMVYIDMNMVRAGVVDHPGQWPFCGYNEIQNPRRRYALIDYPRVMGLLHMRDFEGLQECYRGWVDEAVRSHKRDRESKWTESVAVGSKHFVEATKERLGMKAKWRKVLGANGTYELREPGVPYSCDFGVENGVLSLPNTYSWK